MDDILEGPDGSLSFRSEQSAWGAVVNFERIGSKAAEGEQPSTSGQGKEARWVVDVLVNCAPKGSPGQGPQR